MNMHDTELDRRLAALPRVVETPEALWPGIERRLTARTPRIWAAAVGTGLLAAIAGGLWIQGGLVPRPVDPAAVVVATEVENMGLSAPRVTRTAVDEGWQAAWEDNEAAIRELEQALENHPGNVLLLDFLAQARLRQSRMINHAMAGGAVEIEWRT